MPWSLIIMLQSSAIDTKAQSSAIVSTYHTMAEFWVYIENVRFTGQHKNRDSLGLNRKLLLFLEFVDLLLCFSESLETKETLLTEKFNIRSLMSEQTWWLTQLSLLLCCPVNGTQEILFLRSLSDNW